jgi:hypothetical protein
MKLEASRPRPWASAFYIAARPQDGAAMEGSKKNIFPVALAGPFTSLSTMENVRIRRLRDERQDRSYWKNSTHQERIKAVETINRLGEKEYAEQTFPRIHRVTRKKKS